MSAILLSYGMGEKERKRGEKIQESWGKERMKSRGELII
jgi:hypothetical protein